MSPFFGFDAVCVVLAFNNATFARTTNAPSALKRDTTTLSNGDAQQIAFIRRVYHLVVICYKSNFNHGILPSWIIDFFATDLEIAKSNELVYLGFSLFERVKCFQEFGWHPIHPTLVLYNLDIAISEQLSEMEGGKVPIIKIILISFHNFCISIQAGFINTGFTSHYYVHGNPS